MIVGTRLFVSVMFVAGPFAGACATRAAECGPVPAAATSQGGEDTATTELPGDRGGAAAVEPGALELPMAAGQNQLVVRAGGEAYGPCPPTLPTPCEMAVLEGDPRAQTLFTTRFRVAQGFLLPPHSHAKAERVTIISGKVGVGFGDEVDTSAGRLFGPGDYYVNAPGVHHFVWAEEDSVVQVHGIGPWSATPVAKR